MKKVVQTLLTALMLAIGVFSLSTAPSFAQTSNPCERIELEEGQEVDLSSYSQTFADFDACIATIGSCCIANSTRYGMTPSECNGALGTPGICQVTGCYTKVNAAGECALINPSQCEAAEKQGTATFSTPEACKASSTNPVVGCYAKLGSASECAVINPTQCETALKQGVPTYASLEACKASNGGGSCTSEAGCPGADLVCNMSNNRCESKGTAIGSSGKCDINFKYSTNGAAGALCCQGGESECASGACSGSGNETFGTCLAGTGGPAGPTCTGPNEYRCGGCNGGFCSTDNQKNCNQQAFERCGEVVTGGSCALTVTGGEDTYDEDKNMCTHYCTNIVGRNGDDCSASAGRPPGTCEYVGPENPLYDAMCPSGNGYGDFGWNGQCFNTAQIPNNAIVTSYYCACPNNNCTGVSLGQGCQQSPMPGNACYQTGTCGILQVDIDIANPTTGQTQHTSRNKFITSGCSETPVVVIPPDDVIPNPPDDDDDDYFCNSPCTTNAQCDSADSRFSCNAAAGNRCRLETNPGSANCQPPTGPQCLSLSLTNVSNPTAPATADPELGDAVTFTCGLVNGAQRYIFRVIEPDGTIVNLQSTGATSAQYTIDQDGAFGAQCQICTGAADSTCHAYENPF